MKKDITKKRTKITLFFIEFILFVYKNYILEDWGIYTKAGKLVIYPAWFIRSTLVWLISPILLPEFLFRRSKLYKEIQKIMNSKEFKDHMAMSMKRFNMPNMPM